MRNIKQTFTYLTTLISEIIVKNFLLYAHIRSAYTNVHRVSAVYSIFRKKTRHVATVILSCCVLSPKEITPVVVAMMGRGRVINFINDRFARDRVKTRTRITRTRRMTSPAAGLVHRHPWARTRDANTLASRRHRAEPRASARERQVEKGKSTQKWMNVAKRGRAVVLQGFSISKWTTKVHQRDASNFWESSQSIEIRL